AAEVELKRVAGTRVVQTLGGPGRSVRVLLDAARMQSSGISTQDVRNALLAANVSLPAGNLVGNNRDILVEAGAYLASGADVARLVVGRQGGRPVYVSDIAQIVD